MTTTNKNLEQECSSTLILYKEGRNFEDIPLDNYERAPEYITENDIERPSYQDYVGFEIVRYLESAKEMIRVWNLKDPEKHITLSFSDFENRKIMTVIQQLGYVDKSCFLDLKRAIDERQKQNKITWLHEQIGFDTYQGKPIFKYYNLLNAPFVSTYTGNDFSQKSRVCNINQTSCEIQTKGTVKGWAAGIRKFAKDHIYIQIILCAALSGLVQMFFEDLSMENLIINICGDSSIGKSQICKLALAMFGSPTKLFRTQNNTHNALNKLLAKNYFIPITADDRLAGENASSSKIEAQKLIQFIFKIADGKVRGTAEKENNQDNTRYYCPILMSTEASIAEAMLSSNRSGQFARVLEINCGKGDLISSKEIVREIDHFSNSHYGAAVEPLVQYFLKNKEILQLDKLFDSFKNQTFDIIERILISSNMSADGKVDRLSKQIAVILLSAELLNRTFDLEFDISTIQQTLANQIALQLQTLTEQDSDMKTILQFVNNPTKKLANSVQEFDAEQHDAILLTRRNGCAELIVPKDNIGQIFDKSGRTKTLKRLKERDILLCGDDGRLTRSRVIKSGDGRAYVFLIG